MVIAHYIRVSTKLRLIKRLHKWLGKARGDNIYNKGKKGECKLVYLTFVWAVLAEAEDFGSRKAISFFEWSLASFTRVFHFSVVKPLTAVAFAQSTF